MGKLISIGLIIVTVILLAILSCLFILKESTASGSAMSTSRYVQMFVDPEYGCQYLTTMDGGITSRKNLKGEHVGCNK